MIWWNPLTWFARACSQKCKCVNRILKEEVKASNYLCLDSGDLFYHLGKKYMKIGYQFARDNETGDIVPVQHLVGYDVEHGMHIWQILEKKNGR